MAAGCAGCPPRTARELDVTADLPGASHLPLVERPEPYRSAVRAFLLEVEEGSWS